MPAQGQAMSLRWVKVGGDSLGGFGVGTRQCRVPTGNRES
jgi:hypothetical protein